MTAREVVESFRDAADDLEGMMVDAAGDSGDVPHIVIAGRPFGEFEITLGHVAAEVGGSVAVSADVGQLDFIKDGADFGRSESGMIEEGAELLEGALEVDIVLPEGVVGVDQEMLAHAVSR